MIENLFFPEVKETAAWHAARLHYYRGRDFLSSLFGVEIPAVTSETKKS